MSDSIAFEVTVHNLERKVATVINGLGLIGLAHEYERKHSSSGKTVGTYGPMPHWWFCDKQTLIKPRSGTGLKFRTAVLMCECGEDGCGDLSATVTIARTHVIWSHFGSRYGSKHDCSYEEMGRFTFDRTQYFDAINRMIDEMGAMPTDAYPK
jgi:hypothetical protein